MSTDRHPDPFGVGRSDVFICENPAVLEAAAKRLGPACPPLLCTEGHLAPAARALLRALRERGARFRYHGDFDWGGIQIANSVFALINATPWRHTSRAVRIEEEHVLSELLAALDAYSRDRRRPAR